MLWMTTYWLQEYKFKSDDQVKKVLQHGKVNDDIFILDYGYPFSPI